MLVSKDCLRLKLAKVLAAADDFIWVSGADAVKLNTIGVGNYINLTISDNRGCETVRYDHIAQWPATSAPKQIPVLRDVSATGRRNFGVGTCVAADWSVAQMRDFVAQEVCNSPCLGGARSAGSSLRTVVADLPTGSSSLQFAKFYFDAHTNGAPIQQSFQLHSIFDNIGITTGVGTLGGHYIELPDGVYDISFNFDFSYSSVTTDPRVLLVFKQVDTGYPESVDGLGAFEINIDGAPEGTYMAQRFVSVPSSPPNTNRFELALLLIDPQAGWRAGAVNILKLA